MGIQITVPANETAFGVALEKGYARVTSVQIDFVNEQMAFTSAVWASKEAFDAGSQPIMPLPGIVIRKEAQEAQFGILTDQRTGKPILDGDGKPQVKQTAPALQSFSEALTDVAAKFAEGKDSRAVGYDALKKLDAIKNNSPVDV